MRSTPSSISLRCCCAPDGQLRRSFELRTFHPRLDTSGTTHVLRLYAVVTLGCVQAVSCECDHGCVTGQWINLFRFNRIHAWENGTSTSDRVPTLY